MGIDLSIEVIADGRCMVGRSMRILDAPASKGEPSLLDCSLDENQCLTLRLFRPEGTEEEDGLKDCHDAPLTHIEQGHAARSRLFDAEVTVNTAAIPGETPGGAFTQMARDAAVIDQHEKALHGIICAMPALRTKRNLRQLHAVHLEALGSFERAEHACLQVADGRRVQPCPVPASSEAPRGSAGASRSGA